MMRRGSRKGGFNGTLIPYTYLSVESIVVLVDRTDVEKWLRLVTVT